MNGKKKYRAVNLLRTRMSGWFEGERSLGGGGKFVLFEAVREGAAHE